MVNVVLGLSVLVLSSVLAVLYLVREIRVGDTDRDRDGDDTRLYGGSFGGRVEEIEVHVGVLLFLSGGLLGLFNWFVGGLRRVEEEREGEGDVRGDVGKGASS